MQKRRSIIRLLVAGAVVLNLVAIGLGRMLAAAPSWRRLEPARRAAINPYVAESTGPGLAYLDLETGRVERLPLPEGDLVDEASWSPWRDELGRSQVVGRWVNRTGEGTNLLGREFGLAHYTYPDGEVLDQVSATEVPTSPPCWLPGTQARVLFAAADGGLYRFDFEGASGSRATLSGRDKEPRPVTWNCDRPGSGRVAIREPYWPLDGRFDHRIIVSLAYELEKPDGPCISPTELWWLELNKDATAVEHAGRLTSAGSTPIDGRTERYPVVGRSADGGLLLACLSRPEERMAWDVLVAPIDFTAAAPAADLARARVVAEGCQPIPPLLSADGRWTACIQDFDGKRATHRVQIREFPAPKTLARGPKAAHPSGA